MPQQQPPHAESAPNDGPSKAKMMFVVGAILFAEAAAIVGAMMVFGSPSDVQAAGAGLDAAAAEEEKITEILVLDDKLANARAGVTYLYDTEVYVQTKRKYANRVTDELAQFGNEIKAEISAVWRISDPHEFQEPRLESLTRKVYALLNDRFGTDPETGEPIIEKCVLLTGTGFRIDS